MDYYRRSITRGDEAVVVNRAAANSAVGGGAENCTEGCHVQFRVHRLGDRIRRAPEEDAGTGHVVGGDRVVSYRER